MPSNAAFGFRPYRHLSGGDSQRVREYPIASGAAGNIFTGDAVKLASDGTILIAAAGDRILGIFMGVSFVNSSGEQKFERNWVTTTVATDIKASVVDDPQVVFQVMSAGTPTQTNVGNLADHVVGSGSALTGISGASLSATMTSADAGFRILGLSKEPGNSGANALLEVVIFEHEHSHDRPATPGI